MKRILMASLLLVMTILTGCGGIKEPQKIIIGLDDEYPPFGFRNEQNEIVGFDIDLAKETAKRMGVAVEFKPIDWNLKVEELNSRHIDIIWNGLDITPDRKELILYSKPYMDNRQIIFVAKDSGFKIQSPSDLAGKIVGTQAGSTSEVYIAQDEKFKNSFHEYKLYDTYKNAFKDLENGAVEALICDELPARYEMNRNVDKFEVIEVTIGPVTEIGIGFRKDDTALRDRVQKVFDEMVKDGTAKKISEKWFQADLIKSKREY